MNKLVEFTLSKYHMLSKGDSVIVALSGGADSVSLLDIINSQKEKYDLSIFIAHINHNLRGEEAMRDENFCKALAEKYGLEIFVKSVDVRSLAKKQKISEELCGRNVRYEFFEELSQKLNAKIATAHTASDNAETLLFNIARGSSVAGVSAIPPIRDNIIRPLIEVTRDDVERYCAEHNLDYVTDSTNLADDYTRNSIRHNVIPQLKKINPNFEGAVNRLSENAMEITDYINAQTKKALDFCCTSYGYDCKKLLGFDRVIVKNAIVVLCKECGATVEHRHIELILDIINSSGAVDLSDNIKAVAKQGVFRIYVATDKNKKDNYRLSETMDFSYNNKRVIVGKKSTSTNEKNTVDGSFVTANAVFRTRQSGDKFTYYKRNVTKPLRKVMNELKIPDELRDSLIVLAIGSTVLWCEQIGYSAQGKPKSSNEVLQIEIIN